MMIIVPAIAVFGICTLSLPSDSLKYVCLLNAYFAVMACFLEEITV